ncbi:G-type lectin S-receptor-like serine/threonine-protein kinase At4g27290 [Apium graveolens]|uniref:G-type lectin S-receptor-like serine/threonine-protein kinase At4g27290 n=1 Tax=Apium graveolens TaxID=4045 RepID=UPI003D7C0369
MPVCYIGNKKYWIRRLYFKDDGGNRNNDEDLELPLFDFTTIANATNGFSTNSKLGEGGLGPVYKGLLGEGRDIAVKRLSKNSTQVLKEFQDEVSCIARLQHQNLVKLLRCSMQGGERMLVGYMSPEYAIDGKFLVKFDVYSFGVMMLEIVSGKRNSNFTHPDDNLSLLEHAWRSCTISELLDIVDEVIAKSIHEHQFEVFRVMRATISTSETPP